MEEERYRQERIITTKNLDVVFSARSDKGSFVTPHWHNTIEIIYIIRGSTDVLSGARTSTVHAGELMVINAGAVHSTRNLYGNDCILLQIPLEIPGRFIQNIKTVNFDVPVPCEDAKAREGSERLKNIIWQMKKVLDRGEEGYGLKFESLLYDLLYHLYVDFGRRNHRAIPATVREEDDRLKKVLDYTADHYREAISLKEISDVIHLQPEYFCRYFKRCMGMTYLAYLNEVRLSGIYEDLIHTDWPLYKILQLHGFKNYKLFRKLFYSRFGCTPGQFREKAAVYGERQI